MPDQKQRERPREEPAPWTPKEQSPFDGRAHRTFKSLTHPALSKSSNQSIAIKKEDRPEGLSIVSDNPLGFAENDFQPSISSKLSGTSAGYWPVAGKKFYGKP
jgi:hypothetical protein